MCVRAGYSAGRGVFIFSLVFTAARHASCFDLTFEFGCVRLLGEQSRWLPKGVSKCQFQFSPKC